MALTSLTYVIMINGHADFATPITPDWAQARERSQRSWDEKKAVKVANGTARPRGRPPKVKKAANGTTSRPRGSLKKVA